MSILGDILKSISKPGRDVAELNRLISTVRQMDPSINKNLDTLEKRRKAQESLETYTPKYQTQDEQLGTFLKPGETTLRNAATVGSFMVPAGVAGSIAKRAGAGAVGGALGTYGMNPITQETDLLKVLGGGLLGGAIGGTIGAVEKGVGKLAANKTSKLTGKQNIETYLDDIKDVKQVAALPKGAKSGLGKLAKSAGFSDPTVSESKNILNYINNRKLAGVTPGQTLENMTQEFKNASRLKKAGLNEIGGLSKGYIQQIEGKIDEAVQYSGLGATETNALARMKAVLEKAPNDAKTLDKIAQDWYNMSLTRAGEQKMSQAGLYKEGARAIRNALKEVNKGGSYSSGMSMLSRILGLEDEGAVSLAASQAEKTGINLPMFQNAGVYGTDIKIPAIANTVSKAQAGIGASQLQKAAGNIAQTLPQGAEQMPKFMQALFGGAARTLPPMVGVSGQQQMTQDNRITNDLVSRGLLPQSEAELYPQGIQQGIPQQPEQGPQIDELAIIQAVLSGALSTTDAKFIMDTLGGGSQAKMTEKQKQFMAAGQIAGEALSLLEGGEAKSGKIQNIGSSIGEFFGTQAPGQTEYLAKLQAATASAISALSGANVPPSEFARIVKFIPAPTDEYNIAAQKLRSFQEAMNVYANPANSGNGTAMGGDTTSLLQSLGLQ